MAKVKYRYYPVTPGGTVCYHLASSTEKAAWNKLINDTRHMPYKTKENLIKRGYTIERAKACCQED